MNCTVLCRASRKCSLLCADTVLLPSCYTSIYNWSLDEKKLKLWTLDSQIDVGQAKNVGSGKFCLLWSLEYYVTKVIQIKINIFHFSALINFKSSTNFSFGIKKLVRSLQKIMETQKLQKMWFKCLQITKNGWYLMVL